MTKKERYYDLKHIAGVRYCWHVRLSTGIDLERKKKHIFKWLFELGWHLKGTKKWDDQGVVASNIITINRAMP